MPSCQLEATQANETGRQLSSFIVYVPGIWYTEVLCLEVPVLTIMASLDGSDWRCLVQLLCHKAVHQMLPGTHTSRTQRWKATPHGLSSASDSVRFTASVYGISIPHYNGSWRSKESLLYQIKKVN